MNGTKSKLCHLVVDCVIEVLNENVTLASLAKGRVALRPHNAASTTLDKGIVELLQSALA